MRTCECEIDRCNGVGVVKSIGGASALSGRNQSVGMLTPASGCDINRWCVGVEWSESIGKLTPASGCDINRWCCQREYWNQLASLHQRQVMTSIGGVSA